MADAEHGGGRELGSQQEPGEKKKTRKHCGILNALTPGVSIVFYQAPCASPTFARIAPASAGSSFVSSSRRFDVAVPACLRFWFRHIQRQENGQHLGLVANDEPLVQGREVFCAAPGRKRRSDKDPPVGSATGSEASPLDARVAQG